MEGFVVWKLEWFVSYQSDVSYFLQLTEFQASCSLLFISRLTFFFCRACLLKSVWSRCCSWFFVALETLFVPLVALRLMHDLSRTCPVPKVFIIKFRSWHGRQCGDGKSLTVVAYRKTDWFAYVRALSTLGNVNGSASDHICLIIFCVSLIFLPLYLFEVKLLSNPRFRSVVRSAISTEIFSRRIRIHAIHIYRPWDSVGDRMTATDSVL